MNFDKLDFVFIDGSEKFLPWKKSGHKFKILLKMCKITGKCLFCCSVGMQNIVFFLATNYLPVFRSLHRKSMLLTLMEN